VRRSFLRMEVEFDSYPFDKFRVNSDGIEKEMT
jgi:hypothetical protein